MRRSDFTYELPDELIAQYPPVARSAGRLLCLDGSSGVYADRRVVDFPGLLQAGDLLVLNDTRVISARLDARKQSGGRAEVLIERMQGKYAACALIRASRAPRAGSWLVFADGSRAKVLGRDDDMFRLRFDQPVLDLLEAHGHVPLPPYIQRQDDDSDLERYQTVFAKNPGAVAAPTAGLHFDQAILDRIAEKNVKIGYVTLHVGAGTFQPVRCDDIRDHQMHAEWVEIDEQLVAQIRECRQRGGRVVAVGTTVVRSLETACSDDNQGGNHDGEPKAFTGDTRMFIFPGYRFRCVDALLSNFHLPESTLLMLVCAFAGHDNVLNAYRHAVQEQYRFFSYGDAMFITPETGAQR